MSACTIQSLLQQHLADYLTRHKLPLYQLKAAEAMKACRTAALGGHTLYCEHGHLNGVWYNSCKHRGCPQCQGIQQERWLEQTQAFLLDCPHHHIVFTLPHQLNALWRWNRATMIDLLFDAVGRTLATLTQDTQYLGAKPGYLCALHTWGRDLALHPHIHCLITDGGMNEHGSWQRPKKSCFLPARVVMTLYRGKLLAAIREGLGSGRLKVPAGQHRQGLLNQCNKLGRIKWTTYFCERYDHAQGVAKYLARYVKSGAYHNGQLLGERQGKVVFSYTSHRSHQRETSRFHIDDFISRVLEHTPIPGKATVRRYGLYHGKCRPALNQARSHHQQATVNLPKPMAWEDYLSEKGHRPVCRECGQPLRLQGEIKPERDRARSKVAA